jgi:hypothetical protein
MAATRVVDLELLGTTEVHEVNPLVRLQPSTSDLAVKCRYIEVDESQYLCKELNNKKAHMQLAEQRCNEKLRQSQEAQRQEMTSVQIHAREHNILVEARYTEQLQQSKQVFQQELLQKEQAMQREIQERSDAM